MRRTMGPLTPEDMATVRAFESSLRAAHQAATRVMASMAAASEPIRQAAVQIAKTQALERSFDAAPRHRRLPTRATVIEWLDRHLPPAAVRIVEDPHPGPVLDGDAQQRMVQWFVEMRADAVRRYRADPEAFARQFAGEREGRWVEHQLAEPVGVEPGVEYVAEYPADLPGQAALRELRRRLVDEQQHMPYDGPPVDVERDQGGPYRSMWPGGIGA